MKALEILNTQLKYTWELYEIGHKHLDDINSLKEAINELQELDNRSCDNCKYIKIIKCRGYEWAVCTNQNCDEMYDCGVGNDFCCNKWEK